MSLPKPHAPGSIVALWTALIACVALGVVAVGLRLRHPSDAAMQLEELRQTILSIVHDTQVPPGSRLTEVASFDGRFRDHSLMTFAHIVTGGVFLVFVPLQLARPVRDRFPAFHRWTGRTLIALAIVAGMTGLYFGLVMPFGGAGEALAIAIVGAWLFISVARAYAAIRRGEVARHREWMLRAVAACAGVSVVRVVGAVADITLTPNGLRPTDAFIVALWTGWGLTFVVTEWWIARTRNPRP